MATLITDPMRTRPGRVRPGELSNRRRNLINRSTPRRPSLGPRNGVAQTTSAPQSPNRYAPRHRRRWRVLHVSGSLLHATQMGRRQSKTESLHAANPANRDVPSMRVLGSATIPEVWAPEDKVHNIAERVVDELPYGLIVGARFFRTNNSVLDFGVGKGFKPTPSSCWIPFAVRSMNPVISPLT